MAKGKKVVKIDGERRKERILQILENEPALVSNEYRVPNHPKRYLAVEWDEGDIVWAQDVESLEAAKEFFNTSDTLRDSAWVYDLDHLQHWVAVTKVTDFILDED